VREFTGADPSTSLRFAQDDGFLEAEVKREIVKNSANKLEIVNETPVPFHRTKKNTFAL
jgi:hypothetical protein